MNNFDYILLENFLKENIDFLKNSRIQKIQQPTRTELVFSIRNLGETRKFYININPSMFHICFMSKENEEKRFIKIHIMSDYKKLLRNLNNKMLGGVCSGIADYFNVDPTLVRAIFIVAFLAGTLGFWAYVLLWIFIPANN